MSKRILFIGGSSGIGLELAKILTDQGHEVMAMSRKRGDLKDLDVSHQEVDILKDELPEVDGKLDGLVYLPGSINLKPFSNFDVSDFQEDFDINAKGLVKTLQAYHKNLKKSDQASVVAFSTVAVQTGMQYHASIAAAKGAVEGIVRSLAAEWAPKIRVNAVAPSLVDTPLADRLLRNEKQRKASEERHPLQRVGEPGDIANAAAYLLSDQSSWVTGQILGVDGGMSVVKGL